MLAKLYRAWMEVLTKPSTATFESHVAEANLGNAVVGVLVTGVVAGILSAIWIAAFGVNAGIGTGGEVANRGVSAVSTIFSTPIGAVVGLLVGSAILLAFAKIFGGTGNYTVQTYLVSLFIAPLSVVSALLGWIPWFGWLVSLAVGIYELVLLTMAVKAAHQVSTGRAVLIWILPGVIIGFIVLACLLIVLAAVGLTLFGISR
jgi:hypothetical protein